MAIWTTGPLQRLLAATACYGLPQNSSKSCGVLPYVHLGKVPYTKALRLQECLVRRRIDLNNTSDDERSRAGVSDLLILLEHPPTFTAGRRIKGQDEEGTRLKVLGADYVETLRGGQATFHGPGQLVGYPILDIRNYKLSVRCYVSSLEKTIIETCAKYDIKAETTEHTGVWMNGTHKIAAIGIQVQRYITSHGIALNCDTDLTWFDHIVPCGLQDKFVTSLSEQLGRGVTTEEVIPQYCNAFGGVFGRQMTKLEDVEGGKELWNEIDEVLRSS
ncbi:hypothetical protein BC938DRAFT_481550 [Jimgerdemannia flammicorona]|uniref:lipoyl(octanoyl) transferase n=1 Tax=Jimgerdemannia flammicorona TaxID=994334 RepID=A0A433QGJ4_9FUNG|nr:hypothetical protein BC938DRAFT_481550 [Jimgerdemannia flammicorona]